MTRLAAAICAGLLVYVSARAVAGRPVKIGGRGQRGRRRLNRQVWLSQAGAAVTPGQFWAVCAATAAVAFMVLFALVRTVVVAAVPAVGLGALPYLYWSVERRKRADARFQAWPDALRHVTGSLRAGIASMHEALEELAISGPEPLRAPFARYTRLVSRGVSDRQALEAIRTELADPVSDPVLLCFELAASEGTDVAVTVLNDLATQITGDLELAERIQTVQTQSRIASWGVFILPYGVLIFLCATKPEYRSFFSTSIGLLIVLAGAVVSVIGFTAARALAKPIATQQRVFTTDTAQPAAATAAAAGGGEGR